MARLASAPKCWEFSYCCNHSGHHLYYWIIFQHAHACTHKFVLSLSMSSHAHINLYSVSELLGCFCVLTSVSVGAVCVGVGIKDPSVPCVCALVYP